MNASRLSQRNRDVRRATVITIGKKEQVRSLEIDDLVGDLTAAFSLHPRITRELSAVQREDGLHEARAVGSPRRDSAPLIRGTSEQLARAKNQRCLLYTSPSP